jgi:hypothetical protein
MTGARSSSPQPFLGGFRILPSGFQLFGFLGVKFRPLQFRHFQVSFRRILMFSRYATQARDLRQRLQSTVSGFIASEMEDACAFKLQSVVKVRYLPSVHLNAAPA